MYCPKCNHGQSDNNLGCDTCGVIFAKFHQRIREKKAESPHNDLTSVLFNSEFMVNPLPLPAGGFSLLYSLF